jgi:two-component system CitB family sensor kinase
MLARARLPLAYQILAMQVGIVLLAAGAGFLAELWQAKQQLDTQYEQRALAIAEAVASNDGLRQALVAGDPDHSIQQLAEEVRRSTGASYVVVTDWNGIRLSHPNPAKIGKPVDENPASVLAGHTWVGVQQGTLGTSARGKAPIFLDGRVIGMVSVGFLETQVTSQLLSDLPGYAVTVGLALGLGVVASLLLARRLKRQTFGLEPYQIAGLLEEREASLQGIHEGAVATDIEGRITLANEQARRLLGIATDCVGKKVGQVLPAGRLLNFMSGRLNDDDEVILAGDRVLLASRRPVRVGGRQIGHVVTLRDSNELSRLSAGLGVDSLTDALRAQAHEFSNRLHAIVGLVELGRGEDAIKLITDTSGLHQELSEALLDRVGDPVLGAILLAKAAVASERGIELRVSDDTMLSEHPLPGDDLITLLGNLIDNALDAAAGSADERWVSVAVGVEADGLVLRVQDSGPGVAPDLIERIFVEGFTTKRGAGGRRRGLGLTLAMGIAQRNGGRLSVVNEGGAVFSARLPLRKPVEA